MRGANGSAILHYLFEKQGLIDRFQIKIGVMDSLSDIVIRDLEII